MRKFVNLTLCSLEVAAFIHTGEFVRLGIVLVDDEFCGFGRAEKCRDMLIIYKYLACLERSLVRDRHANARF